ncbi:MAG: YbaN family protein [Bacteroidales bacterium]|nr:YbaN family protein [Bacteroidales bacterium]
MKAILIILGTTSLILGIIGIFIPGLPTTPFLLLTAGLYVRSSERLYNLLMQNKYLSTYINKWQKNKSLPLKTKLYAITLMWAMILTSVIFLIGSVYIKIVVTSVGFVGTIVMGFIIPNTKNN